MTGGWRLTVTAGVTALCVACATSPDGPVACAPCPPGLNVQVTGLGRITGSGLRVSVCVSGRPCLEMAVPHRSPGASPAAVACGAISCSLDGSGGLRLWMDHRGGTRAGLPVRVTVTRTGRREPVASGSGVLRHVTQGGPPCGCSFDQASVAVA